LQRRRKNRFVLSPPIIDKKNNPSFNRANNVYVQLYHVIDLKQKQASLSEALSARKQAAIAAENSILQREQAKIAADNSILQREQAEETARQGNTLLVFTVVTIVFVSLDNQAQHEFSIKS